MTHAERRKLELMAFEWALDMNEEDFADPNVDDELVLERVEDMADEHLAEAIEAHHRAKRTA